MSDTTTDLKIRNEFNEWTEAGRGEEMEGGSHKLLAAPRCRPFARAQNEDPIGQWRRLGTMPPEYVRRHSSHSALTGRRYRKLCRYPPSCS